MGTFAIALCASPEDVALCRELFLEYQQGLGISLAFQGFEAELAHLPGDYALPRGGLWLATVEGAPAGCVAVRACAPDEAEMKRLYVRPAYRGRDLGRELAQAAIQGARAMGYRLLRLDTLADMGAAQRLYGQLGFVETAAYNDNPLPGTQFLALDLST
jgi:putative acetyltransferase